MKRLKQYAPKSLGKKGRAFYNAVCKQFIFEDAHARELLRQCAQCLDVIGDCEKELSQAESLVVLDRFSQSKPHPLLSVLRDQKALFTRICRELQLDSEVMQESKPPRLGKYYQVKGMR